jgi:hypothetical protein
MAWISFLHITVQRQLNYWMQKVTPEAIISKPYYLEYLLATAIRSSSVNLAELESPRLERILAAMARLSEMYRCRDYAVVDPAYWPEVIRAAYTVMADDQLSTEFRSEAGRYLQEARSIADHYFDCGFARADTLALSIYQALEEGARTHE